MALLQGNEGGRHRGMVELRFKVPRGFYDSMLLLHGLTGEKRLEWLRRVLINAVEEGLAAFPVRYCWLRKGAVVFSYANGVYTPVAAAVGGERAWPIEVVPFPSALSPGKQGWRVDVTSRGGFEGRDVFVTMESVIGERPPPEA